MDASSPLKQIEKEAVERLTECRQEKTHWEADIREAMFFAAPQEAREVSSTTQKSFRPNDAEQLNSSFAFEMAGDFSTVIMNTFLPEAQHWASRKPGYQIPEVMKERIADQVRTEDRLIFSAIEASDFYQECAKVFTPNLAIGVVGMWIEDPGQAGEFRCYGVPVREIEGCLGPDGKIDTKFVVQHTKYRYVRRIFPNAEFDKALTDTIKNKGKGTVEVRRGFWKYDEENGQDVYRYVGMVGNKVVESSILRGTGSCPLIVGRFNPSVSWFWAAGPLIQALPSLREHDELCLAKIENIDLALRPPISWPDDSYVSVKEGIESGYAYSVRPGSGQDIRRLYDAPSPNIGIYDKQDLETRIKRLFYLDWPEQSGDTPPSATQWLDEMTRAQRRIGTPGLPFWREFCAPVFQRFEYLLKKRGVVRPVEVDGKTISLVPYNPAQRAAEQQEVAQYARFVEIAGMAHPEEFKAFTDGTASIRKLAMKLGADTIWTERDQAQVEGAVDIMSQLIGGAVPGAPAVGGAPSPGQGLDDSGAAPASPLEPQLRMATR